MQCIAVVKKFASTGLVLRRMVQKLRRDERWAGENGEWVVYKPRVKLKEVEKRVEGLYREGEIDEALREADKLAYKSPLDTWLYFLYKASKAADPDERSFWVVCASLSAKYSLPLSGPRIEGDDVWLTSAGALAIGIAMGRVKPKREGRGFKFEISGVTKSINDVKVIEEVPVPE
jgi:hypothetical protein